MGRKIHPAASVSGTVKSVQHFSQALSVSSTNSSDVSITAVSNVNKAYILYNGDTGGSYGAEGSDVRDRSSGMDSFAKVTLSDASTVNVHTVDLDRPDHFSRRSVTAVGSVVEVT